MLMILWKLFFHEFSVEMRDFDISKYFDSEGFGLINFAWLFGKKLPKKSGKPLTLGHLEKVVELGYWVDPDK